MNPGGFGGGQGNGFPPGGYPPGAPPGYPGAPQQPGQQPPGAQQQPYGAPQPGQQYPGAQAPQQPYGAPQQPYGAPQQPYGAPQPAPGQQYPGAQAPQPYGVPPGYGVPAPGAYGAPAMPGQVPHAMHMAGAMQAGGAGHNSFGQAQSALAGAGGMMKAMKWGFVGIGGLCVLGGVVMIFAVDAVTGISLAFTGGVFVVVALLVLPRFSGMLGQATAMVDGFAAKEQLAQTGIPAMGRLISVQQTGRLVNYNPEIAALVEVQHPQLGVYQTQTTAVVPQIAIPRAQPGAPVQVRVSPQNQHEIALIF